MESDVPLVDPGVVEVVSELPTVDPKVVLVKSKLPPVDPTVVKESRFKTRPEVVYRCN